MSEDQVTQTVVDEAKSPAEPGAAADSARNEDDLDALLAQFEDKGDARPSTPTKPEPKAVQADEIAAARDEVLRARDEILREKWTKDMRATVAAVRGELPSDIFDDKLVQAWIEARAMDDSRLTQAWKDRDANPQQFKRIVGALGREFTQKYGKLPDKNATEDREAVAAAVRGASTKAPEGKPPDFSGMQNREYNQTVKQLYGFDPGV